MAHYLPPAIMRFFQPRPPIDVSIPVLKRKMPDYHGVASFVHRFKNDIPIAPVLQTAPEKREKRQKKRLEAAAVRLKRHVDKWDPRAENPDATGDAYKTLFIARLAYDVTDEDLKDEFEYYGPVTKVRIVQNKKSSKSRGYGFIEFESSRDLKEAYKDADGRKINARRILVDVERGRTVKNWQPRRLGGGLGGTRIGGEDVNQKFSGREPPRSADGSRAPPSSDRDRGRSDRDRRSSGDRERRSSGGGDRDRSRRTSGERSGRSERSGGDRERRR